MPHNDTSAVNAHINNRLTEELSEAKDMMVQLLPSETKLNNIKLHHALDVACHYQTSSELGGDFYDINSFVGGQVEFYLWDFSGHGVSAAINTFRLYSIINDNNSCIVRDPGIFLTSINSILYHMLNRQHFATMFYAIIDPKKKTMSYACASCPAPLLLSFKNNKYELLDSKEFPLGIQNFSDFKTKQLALDAWDSVILYSDALIETQDAQGNFLKITELAKHLLASHHPSHQQDAKEIKEQILSFFSINRLQNLGDDLTLKIINLNSGLPKHSS